MHTDAVEDASGSDDGLALDLDDLELGAHGRLPHLSGFVVPSWLRAGKGWHEHNLVDDDRVGVGVVHAVCAVEARVFSWRSEHLVAHSLVHGCDVVGDAGLDGVGVQLVVADDELLGADGDEPHVWWWWDRVHSLLLGVAAGVLVSVSGRPETRILPTNVLSCVDVLWIGSREVRDEVLERLPEPDDLRRALWRVFVVDQVGGQSDAFARVQVVVASAMYKRSGVVADKISGKKKEKGERCVHSQAW